MIIEALRQAAMAGSVISTDVYMQAPYVCTGLSPISERYCIIISSCYIFTAIDNNFNFNLSWNIIISSSNNGSGCYVVVIIIVIMSV
jgi:hypothetical protein